MQEEVWIDVVGYELLYQISNIGNVRSLEKNINHYRGGVFVLKGRELKPILSNTGYLTVNLRKNGKTKPRTIHQLVEEAFLNHIPCGYKLVVNHINLDKTDNRVKNLEIVTARENCNRKHLKSSSQYTGVSWNKFLNKWVSKIQINGKSNHIGCFVNEYDAHIAYQNELNNIKNE